jgi:hypothetical protein
LVLTGVSTVADIGHSNCHPDFVARSLVELLDNPVRIEAATSGSLVARGGDGALVAAVGEALAERPKHVPRSRAERQ